MDEKTLKRLITSFPDYVEYVYQHIQLPPPTLLQNRIAEILSENSDRLILEAARGTGKSWLASIYCTWRLLRDPDEKVLIVSASGPKSIEIASFVRRLFIQVPLLQHLDPSKSDRDSVLAFDVAGCKVAIAPSVAVVGISGQLTGRRATLVLADDVEVPNNSMTEMMRQKLITQVQEFEALLVPDKPSSILFLGTPQSMESIYNKLPYRTVILPAEVPEDETIYQGKLDPWILLQGKPGDPTDKIRFNSTTLTERKAGYGLAGYKLQYLLDTTLSDQEKFPLKLKDLITLPLDKDEAPMSLSYASSKEYRIQELSNIGFTGDGYYKPMRVSDRYEKYTVKVMAIDPSGSGKDETTYAVLGVLNGYVYIIDAGGTSEGYSDKALVFLADKAKEYSVNTIVLEKNFGSGMFTKLFEAVVAKVYPCTLDEVTSRGQKEVRIINSIEPLASNHKLVMNYTLVEKETEELLKYPDKAIYLLGYQYTHITRDRNSLPHDDRLDALAIGCEYIKDMVVVDADTVLKTIEEREMEKFLYEKIYGKYNYSNPSFISHLR